MSPTPPFLPVPRSGLRAPLRRFVLASLRDPWTPAAAQGLAKRRLFRLGGVDRAGPETTARPPHRATRPPLVGARAPRRAAA